MQIYTFEVNCSICGASGMARPKDVFNIYLNGLSHRDPSICSGNLAYEAERLAEKEQRLKELEIKLSQGIQP